MNTNQGWGGPAEERGRVPWVASLVNLIFQLEFPLLHFQRRFAFCATARIIGLKASISCQSGGNTAEGVEAMGLGSMPASGSLSTKSRKDPSRQKVDGDAMPWRLASGP